MNIEKVNLKGKLATVQHIERSSKTREKIRAILEPHENLKEDRTRKQMDAEQTEAQAEQMPVANNMNSQSHLISSLVNVGYPHTFISFSILSIFQYKELIN